MASRGGRIVAGSRSGARATSRRSSSSMRAPRKRRGRQSSTIPTFRHSPRSTRGRTRTIAYWNGSRGAGTIGLLDERPGRRQPLVEIADVGIALRLGIADNGVHRQPDVGDRRDQIAHEVIVDLGRVARIGGGDRPRVWQQDVLAHELEGPSSVLVRISPRVMDVQGGTVVDQPGTAVPDEKVRVLDGPIRVRDE